MIWSWCGDLFKDARVFLDRASVEITAAAAWLRRFLKPESVVVISGTPDTMRWLRMS